MKKDKTPKPDRNKLAVATFLTKQNSDKGLPMPVKMPDGTDSGITITVRGIDSDAYRHGRAWRSRRSAEILSMKRPEETPEEDWQNHLNDLNHDADLDLLARLVVDWSFPDEFTPEAVKALLVNSPFIANQVDAWACNRARFFVLPSKN
jgi:Phage tail assembly chaperone